MLSCTNAPLSPPTTQIQEPFRIISSTKYALSENDALKEVQAVINMLDPTTRADKKNRSIASIHKIGGETTRVDGTTEDNPTYYIVNFNNNQGFALCSADYRIGPVLCITDSGHLDNGELPQDPELQMMFANYDIDYRIATGLPITDSLGNEFIVPQDMAIAAAKAAAVEDPYTGEIPPDDVEWEFTNPRLLASKGIIIPAYYGTGDPYNRHAPVQNEQLTKAGQTAIAIAEICYNYSFPRAYGNYGFNWKIIHRHMCTDQAFGPSYPGAYDAIARLIYLINSAPNLAANYGIEETTASAQNVPRTFKNLGYASGGSWQGYNFNSLKDCLFENRPALIKGESFQKQNKWAGIVWDTWYTGNHIWVVDQAITQQCTKIIKKNGVEISRTTVYGEFLHCNWGRDGKNNGYFRPNKFMSGSESPLTSTNATTRGIVVRGTEGWYQYNLYMNIGIKVGQ